MAPWYERSRIRCPRCQYDVAQTLADGFSVCPECGDAVSLESCIRDVDAISPNARRLIYACWAAPLLPAWISMLEPRAAWLLLPAIGAVYGSWFWIERWLEPPGAWQRAIGPAIAVLMIDAVVGYGLTLFVQLAIQIAL